MRVVLECIRVCGEYILTLYVQSGEGGKVGFGVDYGG